jgi:hypothetical protein
VKVKTMQNASIQDEYAERYRLVRAGFIARGTSFASWCQAAGVKRQNASAALLGKAGGPKALELVVRILKEAGVTT